MPDAPQEYPTLMFAAMILDAVDPRLPRQERKAAAVRAMVLEPERAATQLVEHLADVYEELAKATGVTVEDLVVRRRRQPH